MNGALNNSMICPPLATSNRVDEADWVELIALSSNLPVTESRFLSMMRDARQDEEDKNFREQLDDDPIDGDIAEPWLEEASQRVLDELEFREETLGTRYPFKIENYRGQWSVKRRERAVSLENQAGQKTYLVGLIISSIRTHRLEIKQDHIVHKRMDKVMQIISYGVSPEILGGSAFWFGFPRPDGTSMRPALLKLAEAMGIATVNDEISMEVNPHAKDGTVDIVAWRNFPDNSSAIPVLYGQVASGKNWKSKPIGSYIHQEFFGWFSSAPMNQKFIEALFIPFVMHQDISEKTNRNFREYSSHQSRGLGLTFGLVIDRLRLAHLAAESARNKSHNRLDDLGPMAVESIRWLRLALEFTHPPLSA